MADKRFLGRSADVTKVFASEDGKHFRGTRQDIDPIIERVRSFKEKVNESSKATNRHDWHYAGSIPVTLLVDWLNKRGYTLDQFARNEGGEAGKTNPRGGGVKDEFMRYFLSRDFAKLHTHHVTTKRERFL